MPAPRSVASLQAIVDGGHELDDGWVAGTGCRHGATDLEAGEGAGKEGDDGGGSSGSNLELHGGDGRKVMWGE